MLSVLPEQVVAHSAFFLLLLSVACTMSMSRPVSRRPASLSPSALVTSKRPAAAASAVVPAAQTPPPSGIVAPTGPAARRRKMHYLGTWSHTARTDLKAGHSLRQFKSS